EIKRGSIRRKLITRNDASNDLTVDQYCGIADTIRSDYSTRSKGLQRHLAGVLRNQVRPSQVNGERSRQQAQQQKKRAGEALRPPVHTATKCFIARRKNLLSGF